MVKVELNEAKLQQMVDAGVREMIASRGEGYDLEEMVKSAIERVVEVEVTEKVHQLTDARIAQVIEDAMTNGWSKTDSYGQPTGQMVTLRSLILERLSSRNTWDDRVLRILDEVLKKELAGETGRLLDEAKARLRTMVDGAIADKLRDGIGEALGLKR